MNFYIVMQGRTYEEERAIGAICSRILDKKGEIPHSWARMKEVKSGDMVFHYVKGDILAISVAQSGCVEAVIPYRTPEEVGYNVQTKYMELDKPLNMKAYFETVQPLLPIKYSAFQENGDGNQGYLYPCNELLAMKLLELISELNIYMEDEEQLEFAMGTIATKERNELVSALIETEAEAKVKLRKGQQKYRELLLERWQQKCALCGIDLPELLRASHSKPWKDSTSEERLDPYNGLLLCCNHDALYDSGHISFDGTGKIHISSAIEEQQYEQLNIHPKMKVQRQEQHKQYFKWHKKHVFKG